MYLFVGPPFLLVLDIYLHTFLAHALELLNHRAKAVTARRRNDAIKGRRYYISYTVGREIGITTLGARGVTTIVEEAFVFSYFPAFLVYTVEGRGGGIRRRCAPYSRLRRH